jgi:hypothetical protein
VTGKINDLSAGFANCYSNFRGRKVLANCKQSRKAEHNIPKLTKINNQDVARIKHNKSSTASVPVRSC